MYTSAKIREQKKERKGEREKGRKREREKERKREREKERKREREKERKREREKEGKKEREKREERRERERKRKTLIGNTTSITYRSNKKLLLLPKYLEQIKYDLLIMSNELGLKHK